jgi:hypothetical protein
VRVLLGVASAYPKAATTYYASPTVEVVAFPELKKDGEPVAFDYYVAPARDGMDGLFPAAPIVFAVEREGARLCVVRRLDGTRIGGRKPR